SSVGRNSRLFLLSASSAPGYSGMKVLADVPGWPVQGWRCIHNTETSVPHEQAVTCLATVPLLLVSKDKPATFQRSQVLTRPLNPRTAPSLNPDSLPSACPTMPWMARHNILIRPRVSAARRECTVSYLRFTPEEFQDIQQVCRRVHLSPD